MIPDLGRIRLARRPELPNLCSPRCVLARQQFLKNLSLDYRCALEAATVEHAEMLEGRCAYMML